MPDVFTKAKRSEVMSRIRAALWQPFGRSGEIAPDESGAQRVGAVGLIEYPALRRVHVVHGLFQHAGGVGLVAASRLDFHRHAFGTALDHEVNFRPVRRAPEEELRVRMPQFLAPDDVFEHEGFPACTVCRMVAHLVERAEVEQMMEQAGVAQINFRGLDEPLADVAEVGRQAAENRQHSTMNRTFPGLLAQSFWLEPAASTSARQHDVVFYTVLYVTAFFFALVVGLMLTFIVLYRRRKGAAQQPGPTHNTPLELFWTGVPLAVVATFFVMGLRAFVDLDTMPSGADVVDVEA